MPVKEAEEEEGEEEEEELTLRYYKFYIGFRCLCEERDRFGLGNIGGILL
jgi:hypothetical protein